MKSKFIIGDVHGCIKTLKALIDKLPSGADIVFVGDLIDRGNSSKDVVEFVKENHYECTLGNHELFMIELENQLLDISNNMENDLLQKWLFKNFGKSTLMNYQSDKELLISHIQWLKTLPLYLEFKDIKDENNRHLVVSHSHVFNKWEYRDYDIDSNEYNEFKKCLLNSRFKNHDNPNIYNVYGHTPSDKPIIEYHKANIDTGCVFGAEVGGLTAIEFPSKRIYTQVLLD